MSARANARGAFRAPVGRCWHCGGVNRPIHSRQMKRGGHGGGEGGKPVPRVQPGSQQTAGSKGDSGDGVTTAGSANQTQAQQGTPASRTRFQHIYEVGRSVSHNADGED